MEFTNNKAIYLQIMDLLCEKVLKGTWEGGDKIPSVRQLAVELEVNPNTVARSYSSLQDDGVIYNKRGIGYFISEDATHLVKKVSKQEFMKQDAPNFFKKINLLGISWEELTQIYQDQFNK
ncbi:GntR family transcriptional regulator [Flammeovirga kamogawensis]|uniref:GntR family transcriptional regulator n=1 Tax=Flammeovirga kamogawensis TaxID=373891 RepID=A0ABX8GUY4_9BACT|nr:GntR family transcriptional regulator [Flammeovirga kamogawensis]MBB6459727.1 DNA-binding transcriptional regulator YhcF (GntR family) [Flammeovirga kamogawensis]QWG07214.1 GntR family transcriptional regulator [Flammeovirga kamogawensis]TRX69034.1 GntR family transcriptional regulator [Flammeovirga kamogawensis]